MRQEQVIELARKHGATSYAHRSDTQNPAYGFTEKQIAALVSEVEQATLERAAQHFDDRGKYEDGAWCYGFYEPQEPGEIIRDLAKEKPCEQPS